MMFFTIKILLEILSNSQQVTSQLNQIVSMILTMSHYVTMSMTVATNLYLIFLSPQKVFHKRIVQDDMLFATSNLL